MIFLYKNNSFYHSTVLDAIDKELEKDFDAPMAEKLRRELSPRLTKRFEEDTNDTFQKELNKIVYPVLAMRDVFEQDGIPDDMASEAVLHIFRQIPREDMRAKIRKALGVSGES